MPMTQADIRSFYQRHWKEQSDGAHTTGDLASSSPIEDRVLYPLYARLLRDLAVRVPQGDAPSLRSVTLPAWPLPSFRSAAWSVMPPLFPRASVLPPRYGLAHAACENPSSLRYAVAQEEHAARQALRSSDSAPA